MSKKEFAFVVFGASGYTGKFVVRELIEQLKQAKIINPVWAIAGRSRSKLIATLDSVVTELRNDHQIRMHLN